MDSEIELLKYRLKDLEQQKQRNLDENTPKSKGEKLKSKGKIEESQDGSQESKGEIPEISLNELKKSIKFPSSILIVGKKFSGKTNLIRSLIDKKKFDNIFVITLSGHTGNLTKLCSDENNCFSNIDDEIIEFILDFQVENPKSKTLLIFDDFIDSETTLRKIPKICQIATSGRNFNITCLISSQTVSQVPTVLRKNAEYLFIGKNYRSSAEQLGKEYANAELSTKELQQKIINIKDHSWLVYDERKGEWKRLPEQEIKVVV